MDLNGLKNISTSFPNGGFISTRLVKRLQQTLRLGISGINNQFIPFAFHPTIPYAHSKCPCVGLR